MSTKIEWTNNTWNPTTGCAKVSAGCKNCYAEKMTKRLAAMGQQKYQGILTPAGRFNGTVRTHEDTLRIPFTWRKPRMVFVNSMSDLFHEDVPFWFIDRVFATMTLTPQHTYQILTKRPDRMAKYLNRDETKKEVYSDALLENHHGREKLPFVPKTWPLPNVWLGTSVEDQKAADERIPHLLKCPAAVRFLSCEPLLGAVDLNNITEKVDGGWQSSTCLIEPHTSIGQATIHWVIAGGESGPDARPMHPDWPRQLRDQCAAAGVAFFFKQWGRWEPGSHIDFERNITLLRNGDTKPYHFRHDDVKDYSVEEWRAQLPMVMHRQPTKGGNVLHGRTHDEFPNRSAPPVLLPNEQHLSSCRTNYLP